MRQLRTLLDRCGMGEPAKQPIEEDDPTAPTNPYGDTKLAIERMLRWYGAPTV